MFRINKIENPKYYVDKYIKHMGEYAIKQREEIEQRFRLNAGSHRKTKDNLNLNKRKDLELEKIRYLCKNLNQVLQKIISSFPKFERLHPIYIDLLNTNFKKLSDLEDALDRFNWIRKEIEKLGDNSIHKIKKTDFNNAIGFTMGKFLGKVNSLFIRNKTYFQTLESCRLFMKDFPKFLDLPTIAICGFPNVGKSTLMKNMTNSNVEIQNYPFTTKGLMFSYIKRSEKNYIQLVDTPGLLNRKKTNQIEQRSILVIRKYSEKLIFVFDFTENCGYTIEEQVKLFKQTKEELNKEIIIYLSKKDIFNEEHIESAEEHTNKFKKFKKFDNAKDLEKHLRESINALDIKLIK